MSELRCPHACPCDSDAECWHECQCGANADDWLDVLERRGVITRDPNQATECCGMPRDMDGFCAHRAEGHPIYIPSEVS